MQPEYRDYLEEYIRALQCVKLRHLLCLKIDGNLIVKGRMERLQGLQSAGCCRSSLQIERQESTQSSPLPLTPV